MSNDTTSALRPVTPPAGEPLTLTQAKSFLRIDQSGDDDAVTRAITSARQFAEQYLRFALLPQTWDYVMANPALGGKSPCHLPLPFGPAQSITSVTLTDALGNATTVDSANYRLSVDGFAVLSTGGLDAENVTIRYNAYSYATADDVPSPILQGMLHHIAAMMESRDGAAPLPMQSVNCYAPYRRVSL